MSWSHSAAIMVGAGGGTLEALPKAVQKVYWEHGSIRVGRFELVWRGDAHDEEAVFGAVLREVDQHGRAESMDPCDLREDIGDALTCLRSAFLGWGLPEPKLWLVFTYR